MSQSLPPSEAQFPLLNMGNYPYLVWLLGCSHEPTKVSIWEMVEHKPHTTFSSSPLIPWGSEDTQTHLGLSAVDSTLWRKSSFGNTECLPTYWHQGRDPDILTEPRNRSVTLSVLTSLSLPLHQPWHHPPKVSPLDLPVGGMSHSVISRRGSTSHPLPLGVISQPHRPHRRYRRRGVASGQEGFDQGTEDFAQNSFPL